VSLESTLYSALTAHAPLAALIGTRLKPDVLPQNCALPAIVYQRIDTPRSQVFGASQAVAVSRPRIQFSCWALTADAALDVCAALRVALRSLPMPVALENEYTLRDPDSNYYRRNLDAVIAHVGE